MDCSLPGSSVHGIFQVKEYWSGLPLSSPGDLPDKGIKPTFPALADRLFTTAPPKKPYKLYLNNSSLFFLISSCPYVFMGFWDPSRLLVKSYELFHLASSRGRKSNHSEIHPEHSLLQRPTVQGKRLYQHLSLCKGKGLHPTSVPSSLPVSPKRERRKQRKMKVKNWGHRYFK